MQIALYHPGHGYYGPGPRRIGRAGDFYTAVSVGPLYGRLLAKLAHQTWERLGSPPDFIIMEQAAHDGQLAQDILDACPFPYLIVEPNPSYQTAQQERLAAYAGRVRWINSIQELAPPAQGSQPALFLCNELLDALPVYLVRWSGKEWQELKVRADAQGGLFFAASRPCAALQEEVAHLPTHLQPGHQVEIHLAAKDWLRELASAPFYGTLCIADYGLNDEEFFLPERAHGTLRRYHQHQMDDRVLEQLGQCDLTSHVPFTRIIATAETLGLKVQSYEHQGRWLSRLALPWLASLEGHPPDTATHALLRQFQALTHPGIMGRSFRALLLEKSATPGAVSLEP
jgi:SAM-dependent MidA family methyltransferase